MNFYCKYVRKKSPGSWALVDLRFKLFKGFCARGGGGGDRVNNLRAEQKDHIKHVVKWAVKLKPGNYAFLSNAHTALQKQW